MYIYIQFDSNGFVTDYKKTEDLSYTKVYILDTWASDFLLFPSKFRYDQDKNQMLAPSNLPSKSFAEIVSGIAEVKKTVNEVSDTNTATTKQVGGIISSLTMGQGAIMNELKAIKDSIANNSTSTTPENDDSTPSETDSKTLDNSLTGQSTEQTSESTSESTVVTPEPKAKPVTVNTVSTTDTAVTANVE